MKTKHSLRTRPRGYLMLDLIIVMMIISVVLTTSSVWVYKTMRYSMEIKQRDIHARAISRISRQLRNDAYLAKSIDVQGMTLSIVDQNQTNIEYLIDSNRIDRRVKVGSKVHQDRFSFADTASLSWAGEVSSGTATLDVRRNFPVAPASSSLHQRRLDAQIRISCSQEDAE